MSKIISNFDDNLSDDFPDICVLCPASTLVPSQVEWYGPS